MKKFFTTRNIAGLGILTAITIILQLFGNYVPNLFGVSINLALIPIVLAACIYGPIGGLFIGLVDGLLVIFAPSTMTLFMPANAIGTVILCLLKTGLAGFVAGFVFLLFKNKHPKIGSFVCSAIVPVINTGIFLLACYLLYVPLIEGFANEAGQSFTTFVLVGFIGVNFFFELGANLLLATLVYVVYSTFERRRKENKN